MSSFLIKEKTKKSFDDKISKLARKTQDNIHASMKSFERFCPECYDGSVIGIAQTVIGSGITAVVSYDDSTYIFSAEDSKLHEKVISKKSFVKGVAQVGPVAGISFNMLRAIPTLIAEMKKGNTNVQDLKMDFTRLNRTEFKKPHDNDKKS